MSALSGLLGLNRLAIWGARVWRNDTIHRKQQ
jgi:hypothetical protein